MAKVDSKGKVTVQKGDTPAKIAKDLGISVAQVNAAIKANPTLAARQSSGKTVLFSGTTFKVPGIGTTGTTGGTPAARTETGRVTNADGSITITYSDGTSETIGGGNRTLPDPYAAAQEANRRSAFALLEKEFTDNNLTTLVPEIKRFMTEGYGAEEASLLLPTTEAYKTRFAGNEGRKKLGLSTYTPGQYLAAEQTYRDLFSQYNLGELANQNTYTALIGGAVSIDEAKARVDNVFSKIDNAPGELKAQLSNYLGSYGVGDATKQRSQIALALMQGPEGINQLETGLRKAYIRTGAATSKINVAEENISQLEKQLTTSGYSTEQIGNISREAYSTLAETLPSVQKLAEISRQDTTGLQEELTQEAFGSTTGTLMPSQRRKKLQEQEQARFTGQSGMSQASLSRSQAGSF
jgi:LysM repeat protein